MEPSLRARVRVGDSDAFSLLFDEYSRAVYNLAFRLTGSWVLDPAGSTAEFRVRHFWGAITVRGSWNPWPARPPSARTAR